MKKISDYKTFHKNIQIYRPRYISIYKDLYYHKNRWIGYTSLYSNRTPDNIKNICNRSEIEDISTISYIKEYVRNLIVKEK